MLQAIRSKTASLVVKALAGLLIISFAAWGIEDFIGARATETTVATVGDVDIEPMSFEFELEREVQALRRSFGGQLTDRQIVDMGIGEAVLQRMINEVVLAEAARDLGIRVSNDQVTLAIQSDPTFHGFDGTFSRTRFNEVMRANGFPEAVYIERVRRDIAANQVLRAISGADAAPSRMAALLRDYRFEARRAETLLVAAAAQPDPGQPTETQMQAVHEAQAERFTAPEYRKITYVHLDPRALTGGIEITEEELRAAYDANAARFVKPERRAIQQIVAVDQEMADAVAKNLAEGRDFMETATEVAEMEAAAVDLGTVTREGLLPDLADAAFALDAGGVTDAIRTPLGWHFLKAVAVEAGEVKTLADVRDEVRELAAMDRAIEALYDLSVRFEDAIGGGATMEEAADSVGLEAVTIDAVDRQGNAPSGARAAGLPDFASLLPLAFSSEVGIESQLTEVGARGFFMVRVDDVIAPALRPLDTIRDEVAQAWRQQRREEMARAEAEKLVERANAGTAMATLADELGQSVETVGPVTRRDSGDANRTVVARMFEIAPRQAGLAKVTDGYRVVFVTEAQAPTGGEDTPSLAEVQDSLDASLGNDLAGQALTAIRDDIGVSVNRRVFDAVIAPGPYDPRRPG